MNEQDFAEALAAGPRMLSDGVVRWSLAGRWSRDGRTLFSGVTGLIIWTAAAGIRLTRRGP